MKPTRFGDQLPNSFVNIAPVSQSDQIEFVLVRIEFVDDTIITNSQSVGVRIFHPKMRECPQAPSNVVHFIFDPLVNLARQSFEASLGFPRPDLRSRTLFNTAHGRRIRTRPAAISALPAAISALKASVISRRSSSTFSSQSRNSSCSCGFSFKTASSTCSKLTQRSISQTLSDSIQ
jgi:hypothetical protein